MITRDNEGQVPIRQDLARIGKQMPNGRIFQTPFVARRRRVYEAELGPGGIPLRILSFMERFALQLSLI